MERIVSATVGKRLLGAYVRSSLEDRAKRTSARFIRVADDGIAQAGMLTTATILVLTIVESTAGAVECRSSRPTDATPDGDGRAPVTVAREFLGAL